MNNPRIIVALDFPDVNQAMALAQQLDPSTCRLKVGKELFTCGGPLLIERLIQADFDIFLDLKFHDIPNTVAAACKIAAGLGVWMINVHAMGGRRMLMAAREAINTEINQPLLVAVTVLTSMNNEELTEIGIDLPVLEAVKKLAKISFESGIDGVVCSAHEANILRECLGNKFCLVTPGIRPSGSEPDDQRRIVTPKDAILAGSDYLVIGRPITQAEDPLSALQVIEKEINEALLLAQ